MRWNSSAVMPACVAATNATRPFSPAAATAFMSPSSSALNGSLSSTPDASAPAPSRGRWRTATWKYIGCSHQSVPSLSKVAMRSATGTKSGPPCVVTRATKSGIDFFAAPSFQDGSGSPPAAARRHRSRAKDRPPPWRRPATAAMIAALYAGHRRLPHCCRAAVTGRRPPSQSFAAAAPASGRC